MDGLSGRVAVVTGAAGGIGAAMCRRLAGEGVRVVAGDIDGPSAVTLAGSLPNALGMRADVSKPGDVDTLIAAAVERFGRLDLFLANAGVLPEAKSVIDFDIDAFERVFRVNVLGVFLSAQSAVRQFVKQGQGGRLLITASIAALQGNAGGSVYVASKHAVHGILRCLTHELGPLGIRVNAIAPGAVDTEMMRSLESGAGLLAGLDAPGMRRAIERNTPLGRYGTPEEVAALAAWLLSDEASYMHGELVTISGGSAH